MTDSDEAPKSAEEKLKSARDHIQMAVSDIVNYCDEDLSKQANEVYENLDSSISSGLIAAADSMAQAINKFKEQIVAHQHNYSKGDES